MWFRNPRSYMGSDTLAIYLPVFLVSLLKTRDLDTHQNRAILRIWKADWVRSDCRTQSAILPMLQHSLVSHKVQTQAATKPKLIYGSIKFMSGCSVPALRLQGPPGDIHSRRSKMITDKWMRHNKTGWEEVGRPVCVVTNYRRDKIFANHMSDKGLI